MISLGCPRHDNCILRDGPWSDCRGVFWMRQSMWPQWLLVGSCSTNKSLCCWRSTIFPLTHSDWPSDHPIQVPLKPWIREMVWEQTIGQEYLHSCCANRLMITFSHSRLCKYDGSESTCYAGPYWGWGWCCPEGSFFSPISVAKGLFLARFP